MIAAPDWFTQDVSRETLEKLTAYAELLRKWNAKINLVAKSTLADLEERHIWDSAQVFTELTGNWCDLGSGGGMPAVVVAILADGLGHETNFTLIESDQRKATFLRTCARELSLPMTILAARVEDAPPQMASIVSARALADLDQLLQWASPHLLSDGACVFMKGAKWKQEIADAQKNWRFSYEAAPSMTHSEAAILTIRDIERV